MKIPCKNCLILSMCKSLAKETDSVFILTRKCSIINTYLRSETSPGKIISQRLQLLRGYFQLSNESSWFILPEERL